MGTPLAELDWPVRTDRLSIRPATPADAGPTWDFRSLPEVAEWVTRLPTDRLAWQEFSSEPERLGKTLVVELGVLVIGDLYLDLRDGWSQAEVAEQATGSEAEIGWTLAPDHQGQGYGTEAVEALLAICFDGLGVRRVVANCFSDNEPSWRLMERLGMRREAHTVRDSLHRTRGWLDGYSYALLAEEWVTKRRGAERRTSSR